MGLELLRPGYDWLQFCRDQLAACHGGVPPGDRCPPVTHELQRLAANHGLDVSLEWLEDRVTLEEQLICTLRVSLGDIVHEIPFFSDHLRNYETSEELRRAVDSKLEHAVQFLRERSH